MARARTIISTETHFFRLLLCVGLITALVSSLTVSTLAAVLIKNTHLQELVYLARSLGNVAATNINDSAELERHLHDFSGAPGLKLSCVYDKENLLIAQWHVPKSVPCPKVLSRTGIQQANHLVKISRPIKKNGTYYGMIYMESSLGAFSQTLLRTFLACVISMFIAGLICILAAKHKAKYASQPIVMLTEYVRCLNSQDNRRCEFPIYDTTETHDMRYNIALLRAADIADKVTIEEMEKKRHWYRGTMLGLLGLLRRRVSEDSSLLPTINDYNLLLKMDDDSTPPKPRQYDLMTLADRVLASIKKIHPVDNDAHTMFSIKPGTPRYWLGQEEIIESFFRNLFLLALRRSSSGMVCLRIEAGVILEGTPASFHFTLEYAGEPLDSTQLEKLLSEHASTIAEYAKPFDLSWIMVARLSSLLKGNLQIRTPSEHPAFTGSILAGTPSTIAVTLPQRQHAAEEKRDTLPFILLIEDDRANREMLRLMFEKAGCRVLAVATAEQAMQWATSMPFSAIVIDTNLPGMQGPEFAIQIKRLLSNGPMPEFRIWALTSSNMAQDQKAWEQAGAEIILVKPLSMQQVLPLCSQLFFCDTCSFLAHSDDIEGGLSEAISKRLPALRQELSRQIEVFIDTVISERSDTSVADAAHAVKSASLSLGYHRLSACMDAVEHMTRSEGAQAIGKENFLYLEEMLGGVIKILHPSVNM